MRIHPHIASRCQATSSCATNAFPACTVRACSSRPGRRPPFRLLVAERAVRAIPSGMAPKRYAPPAGLSSRDRSATPPDFEACWPKRFPCDDVTPVPGLYPRAHGSPECCSREGKSTEGNQERLPRWLTPQYGVGSQQRGTEVVTPGKRVDVLTSPLKGSTLELI